MSARALLLGYQMWPSLPARLAALQVGVNLGEPGYTEVIARETRDVDIQVCTWPSLKGGFCSARASQLRSISSSTGRHQVPQHGLFLQRLCSEACMRAVPHKHCRLQCRCCLLPTRVLPMRHPLCAGCVLQCGLRAHRLLRGCVSLPQPLQIVSCYGWSVSSHFRFDSSGLLRAA